MTTILGRVFAKLRIWLGLNDPSENHLHQAHGWLLPAVAVRPNMDPKAAQGRTGMLPGSRRD